jgi:hypothetical protein
VGRDVVQKLFELLYKKAARMKNCNCQDWLVGIKSILAQSSIAAIHMTPYTGPSFKYCPWCSKELLSESATESSEVQKPSDNSGSTKSRTTAVAQNLGQQR